LGLDHGHLINDDYLEMYSSNEM